MNKISTFKERLKEAMNDCGLSQADLARAIDCNRSKISYYLSGRNEAKDETLFKLAKILDVNSAWLEGYDVPKKGEVSYFYDKKPRLPWSLRGFCFTVVFLSFSEATILCKPTPFYGRLPPAFLVACGFLLPIWLILFSLSSSSSSH